jgi:hypothetical protein
VWFRTKAGLNNKPKKIGDVMNPFFYKTFLSKLVFQGAFAAQPRRQSLKKAEAKLFFDQEPDTVEAQRRRRSPGGPSGRADMPGRSSSSGGDGGGVPPSGSGNRPGGIPGGKGGLSVGAVIIFLVLYLIYSFFCGGGGLLDQNNTSQDQNQVDSQQEANTTVEATPEAVIPQIEDTPAAALPTRTPGQILPTAPGKGAAQTWTIMLYQDADDPILEQDIYMDLNEAESVGSNNQVNIVAQIDRYKGAFQGDGDWTSTRRYYLTQDHDLFHLHSKMVADLGEVSMADPQTLVDFATWAIKTYPADKYVLILSDHGMGWPGGLTDPQPKLRRQVDIPFSQAIEDNMMYTRDFDQALEKIRQQSGIDRFELVGMDACLMSDLEVYSALEPHARYVVNSQETEPALGWAYASFLQALEDNPGMDGAQLGREIVSSFIEKDKRIIDSQARLDFLRQGSPLGGMFSDPQDMDAAQLSREIEKSITLTAADMDGMPALMSSFNQLAFTLQKENPSVIARARTYAQSYTSIFGKDVPPSYIDLGNFAQLLQQESSSSAVRSAAQAVVTEIKQMVVAEKHGSEKPGSTGISIYFPNSQLYRNAIAGARSYTQTTNRFASESLWDDFLAYHYTQASFQIDSTSAAVPGSNARVVVPGSGQIEISPLRLSTTTADYNQPITLESTLKGSNIGYVYLFVGYYDPNGSSILIADKDFLESPKSRQIGNLYYPNWSDNQSFNLKYTWTPSVFTISDGKNSAVALLEPMQYGASAEDAVYAADGIFTDSTSGETRYARMYFSNGQIRRIYGFTGMKPTGPLSEIIPQSGDKVTLIQTWLEPEGSGSYRQVTENGKTLIFSSKPFTWKQMYAAAGSYVLGFVVSDLNGNEKQVFGKVTIR